MGYAKRKLSWFLPVLVVVALNATASNTALATVTFTGNVTPDPSTWTATTMAIVGGTADGTLLVNGGTVSTRSCIVSDTDGVTGLVTVTGGATWNNSKGFAVPGFGTGTLDITGGTVNLTGGSSQQFGIALNSTSCIGTVMVDGSNSLLNCTGLLTTGAGLGTLIISNGGSVTGSATQVFQANLANGGFNRNSIQFGAGGGTLTAQSLWAEQADLTGTGPGTVNTQGWVAGDQGLTFDGLDPNHGLIQTFHYTDSGRNITVNLDMSNSSTVGDLGVGMGHTGSTVTSTLLIQNGIVVTSNNGDLGEQTNCAGTVTGAGSQWITKSNLTVGDGANNSTGVSATLNITNGGVVRTGGNGAVASLHPSSGTVTVDGKDSSGNPSTWAITGTLTVGDFYTAALNVTNGAYLSNSTAHIGQFAPAYGKPTVTMTVDGSGSQWFTTGDINIASPAPGAATLNITTHGSVTATGTTYVGYNSAYTNLVGTIAFGANGGTLTTQGLYAAASNVTGTGTINARGVVSDVDLDFNGSSSATATLNNNVTLNLNVGNSADVGDLGLGFTGGTNHTLQIRNGATVYSKAGQLGRVAGAADTATVTAAEWSMTGDLNVGNAGNGTLYLQSGGTVSNVNGYIANVLGSNGTVTVDGNGGASTWTNSGNLYVGNAGFGTLDVTNGGRVSNVVGYISATSVGVATVEHNSTWTNSGALYLGGSGSDGFGTLNVLSGGSVSNTTGYVGHTTSSLGVAAVDGSGSTWTNTAGLSLCNASNSAATLTISNGGTVITSAVTVTNGSFTTAAVTFNGGTLRAYNAANAAWISQGTATGATFNVYVQTGGATFDTNGYNMGIGMALQHDSTGPAIDGGITKLGLGTLTLTAANTYTGTTTVSAGTVEFGTAAQSAVFAGGASVAHSFMLFDYSGSSSTLLTTLASHERTTANPTGNFTSTNAGAKDVWVNLDNGAGNVEVAYTIPGDANLDFVVDGSDLNTVLSNYNKTGETWSQGDFNGDGKVDGSDLNVVLSNYNQGAGVAASVPEPSTLLLAAAGLLGLLAYAWRKLSVGYASA